MVVVSSCVRLFGGKRKIAAESCDTTVKDATSFATLHACKLTRI